MTKRWLPAALLIAALLSIAPSTARADGTVFVNPPICSLFQGGAVTVPAGSTIVVHAGIAEQTRGTLSAFLEALTTSVSLNGGPSVDLTANWSAPTQRADRSWITTNDYATGVTLAAGQQMRISYTQTLAHLIPEVFNPAAGGEPGKPLFNEPGATVFTCTVTAST